MRALVALCSLCLVACGGLDNLPLTRGVVRGTLERPGPDALVAVFGAPDLAVSPGTDGAFELAQVPSGAVELLLVLDGQRAERRPVELRGGAVLDVGLVSGRPAGVVEARLKAREFMRLVSGEVAVLGTPLRSRVTPTEPARFVLGAGCYQLQLEHPGFEPSEEQACVDEGDLRVEELELPEPDGQPGHEGCLVTGCESQARCESDGRCRQP